MEYYRNVEDGTVKAVEHGSDAEKALLAQKTTPDSRTGQTFPLYESVTTPGAPAADISGVPDWAAGRFSEGALVKHGGKLYIAKGTVAADAAAPDTDTDDWDLVGPSPPSGGTEPETRVPGDQVDCDFLGTWEDGAPGDPVYGFLVVKFGPIVNASGYLTGKALGAGATEQFLSLPVGWRIASGSTIAACKGDGSFIGGLNCDNGLYVQLAPGISLADSDTVQVNLTWAVRD